MAERHFAWLFCGLVSEMETVTVMALSASTGCVTLAVIYQRPAMKP